MAMHAVDDASGLHTVIRGGWDLERSKQLFGEEVVRVHRRNYKIRFTHGDLGVQNILVRNDATVARSLTGSVPVGILSIGNTRWRITMLCCCRSFMTC
jgi:hypothetical protein